MVGLNPPETTKNNPVWLSWLERLIVNQNVPEPSPGTVANNSGV